LSSRQGKSLCFFKNWEKPGKAGMKTCNQAKKHRFLRFCSFSCYIFEKNTVFLEDLLKNLLDIFRKTVVFYLGIGSIV